MPIQASWYLRIPEIVDQLHAPAAPPFLDRAGIESLFRLRRRQAIRLMGACGGYQIGKTYLVDRASLLRYLEELTRTGVATDALERKRRVGEALNESANFVAARRTRIRMDTAARTRANLPAGIELIAPGTLQITYGGATDLLAQIAELASSAANDFPRFQKIVEGQK